MSRSPMKLGGGGLKGLGGGGKLGGGKLLGGGKKLGGGKLGGGNKKLGGGKGIDAKKDYTANKDTTLAGPRATTKGSDKINAAAQDPKKAQEMVDGNLRLKERAQNADPQQLAKDMGISEKAAENLTQAAGGGGAAGGEAAGAAGAAGAGEAAGAAGCGGAGCGGAAEAGGEEAAGGEAGGEAGGLEGILGQIMEMVQGLLGAGGEEEAEQGDLLEQIQGADSPEALAQVLEQAGIQDLQDAPPEIAEAVQAKTAELQGGQQAA